MPELMLRYRSAALFARLYAPEITMGIQTSEELLDMEPEVNGQSARPVFEASASAPVAGPLDCHAQKELPVSTPPEPSSSGQTDCKPEESGNGTAQVVAASETPALSSEQYNYLRAVTGLLGLSKHSEPDLLKFLRNTHRCAESLSSLAEVAAKQPPALQWTHDNWKSVDQELARRKKGRGV